MYVICKLTGREFRERCIYPDSKIHEANMGPIWDRQDPGGTHVGPMNFAIWVWFDNLDVENDDHFHGRVFYIITYLLTGKRGGWPWVGGQYFIIPYLTH